MFETVPRVEFELIAFLFKQIVFDAGFHATSD
jgi:hypothetical protein